MRHATLRSRLPLIPRIISSLTEHTRFHELFMSIYDNMAHSYLSMPEFVLIRIHVMKYREEVFKGRTEGFNIEE